MSRRPRLSPRHVDHAIAQRADALHRALDHVARMQKLRRGAREADAGRCACRDDVTWLERQHAREGGDDGGDIEEHVLCGVLLLQLTVHPQCQAQALWVGDLVGGDDPRANRAAAIETLTLKTLGAPNVLDVTRREIVKDAVAEDGGERIFPHDMAARAPQVNRQLPLPLPPPRTTP